MLRSLALRSLALRSTAWKLASGNLVFFGAEGALWIITHIQQQLDDAQEIRLAFDKGESGEEEADNENLLRLAELGEYHMDVNKRVAWEAALQQFGNKRPAEGLGSTWGLSVTFLLGWGVQGI
ncbi:unnamed protein product [Symbiodinium microadriaticum]|nr:unnamed protein product [Symbiodinium microadriaticum]